MMSRPVDQATAEKRQGRPGLVRLPAPRYPEKYPEKRGDGTPHPKAGLPHPQANQVIRNTVRFVDSDTGEQISEHSTGPAFWNEDGTAVDSDLTAGPPGVLAGGEGG